jgi:hypothetical protein
MDNEQLICKKMDYVVDRLDKLHDKVDDSHKNLNNKVDVNHKAVLEHFLQSEKDHVSKGVFWRVIGILFVLSTGCYGFTYAVMAMVK